MKKQRYTSEFKSEAVKMIIIDGVTVKEQMGQLGVPADVLYACRQKHMDKLEAENPEGAHSSKAYGRRACRPRQKTGQAKVDD